MARCARKISGLTSFGLGGSIRLSFHWPCIAEKSPVGRNLVGMIIYVKWISAKQAHHKFIESVGGLECDVRPVAGGEV